MKKLYTLLTMSALVFATSCSTDPCGKDAATFVKKNTTFFENIKKEGHAYSPENWDKKDGELKILVQDCLPKHKSDLSLNEHKQFWTNVVTYYSNRYGLAKMATEILKDGGIMKDLRQNLKELSLDWKAIFLENNKTQ